VADRTAEGDYPKGDAVVIGAGSAATQLP